MEERFETFTTLVAKIARCIRKIKTEEMEEFGLKSPHVSCLYYLYKKNGEMTAKEISDVCEEDKASISRSLEYLEHTGYIICSSHAEKKYRTPLKLTSKGQETGGKIAMKIDKMLHYTSCGLSDSDREVLYRSLSLISDNLLQICDTYGENKHD